MPTRGSQLGRQIRKHTEGKIDLACAHRPGVVALNRQKPERAVRRLARQRGADAVAE
jgi:hypothetical protein